MKSGVLLFAFFAAIGIPAFSQGQVVFQRLPTLSGGSSASPSETGHVGTYAVGSSSSSTGTMACRWFLANSPVTLGLLSGDTWSSATGLSDNGAIVVGSSYGTNQRGFRWEASTGTMIEIPGLSGLMQCMPTGVSGDGTKIAGTCWNTSTNSAFLWTSATGTTAIASAYTNSRAHAISRSGDYITGVFTDSNGNNQAYLWNSATGLVGLGDLAGGAVDSWAWGVSSAGDAVVGRSTSTNGVEAFRWTPSGMIGLGDLPGGAFYSDANSCSKGGLCVVGYGTTGSGNRAFFWNATAGMKNLADYLVAHGISLAGWSDLQFAYSISEDGKVIVGYGTYNGVGTGFRAYNGGGWQNAT